MHLSFTTSRTLSGALSLWTDAHIPVQFYLSLGQDFPLSGVPPLTLMFIMFYLRFNFCAIWLY